VLEHVVGHLRGDLEVRQPERTIDRIPLRLLDRDLQLGAAAGRITAQ
jgi:hypothetical protein